MNLYQWKRIDDLGFMNDDLSGSNSINNIQKDQKSLIVNHKSKLYFKKQDERRF